MAHEILNGKPYTYLDDAPLEERRTRAVYTAPHAAGGRASSARSTPTRSSASATKPGPQPRDAEEVHDALLSLVAVPAADAVPWHPFVDELIESGRAASIVLQAPEQCK